MIEFPNLSHGGKQPATSHPGCDVSLVLCIRKPLAKGETEGATGIVTSLCYWAIKGTQMRNGSVLGSVLQIPLSQSEGSEQPFKDTLHLSVSVCIYAYYHPY